jgi:hypothetical protein
VPPAIEAADDEVPEDEARLEPEELQAEDHEEIAVSSQ